MLAPIVDCQVLISGGMGTPAYTKAEASGLEIYLAGGMIAGVIQAYLVGELRSDLRRRHEHHTHQPQAKLIAAQDLFSQIPEK